MLRFTSKDDTLRSVHAHLLPGLASWHGNLSSAYEAHSTQSVFSTIPPGAIRPASLSTGIVILPASLLRHMADSGHPPREATPLDQRPAPPRAKKTRGAEKHRRVQILILVRTRFFD
jgi:hypothetical protein